MTPVLDSGALIALERRDPRMVALLEEAVNQRIAIYVPAGAVAQVWRASARQHALARLLASNVVRVEDLSASVALAVGSLLASSGTADVIDAHVALVARRVGGTVITSDPEDIAAIAPSVGIQAI